MSHRSKSILTATVAFLAPFIFYSPFVISVWGFYAKIHNDFQPLFYRYKHYLLDHLVSGTLPLWSPSEAGGYPFYSNPFTQSFYPFNLPLALLYQLNDGYSEYHHQIFTIFGVAIFSLGIYLWLLEFKLSWRAALFASLIMMANYKMGDILRLPNAVHTAAWYPWILWAMTKIGFANQWRVHVAYGSLLIIIGICFVTAGYPYYLYYSVFLFVLYFLFLSIPKMRKLCFDKHFALFKSILTFMLVGIIVLIVTGPYLISVVRLMQETADRGGGNFEYATAYPFTIVDSVGSLIYPPAATADGWYYFSILVFFLVILFLLSKHHGLDQKWYHSTSIKVLFSIAFGVITYITWGRDSFLFILLWKILPGFSSLRAWGRMNIILLPILGVLVAIAYAHFEQLLLSDKVIRRKTIQTVLSVGLLVFIVQICLYLTTSDPYWTLFFNQSKIVYLWATVFSILMLTFALRYPQKISLGLATIFGFIIFTIIFIDPDITRYLGYMDLDYQLFVVGLITTMSLFYLISLFAINKCIKQVQTKWWVSNLTLALLILKGGTITPWMWSPGLGQTPSAYRLHIDQDNMRSFDTNRRDGGDTISLDEEFNINVVPNWYYSRYVNFLDNEDIDLASLHKLLGVTQPDRIFYTPESTYTSVEDFLTSVEQFEDSFSYTIIRYTGDELLLYVELELAGCVSFIDNWNQDWYVTIDNTLSSRTTPGMFGIFKTICINEGFHQILFEYRPQLWWW